MNYKWLNEEQKYKVYEDGKIFSVKKDRFLEPYFNIKAQKYTIYLTINNKINSFNLHRLLYTLFIGEIKNEEYVDFIDNNCHNTHINNLIGKKRNENKNKIEFDENEWKFIPGYEDRYIINRDGEIKSLYTGKNMEDNYSINYEQSYKRIHLTDKNGVRKNFCIHRMVYQTFVGEIDENKVIDHIDQNKFNNKLENLRMVSHSENAKNRIRKIPEPNTDEIKSENFVNLGTKYKNIDLSNYEINDFGQLRNINTKLLLKQSKNKMYNYVRLVDNNKNGNICSIHQLVATTFLENPNNYPIVHHKNEERGNNHVSNLEWTTNKQNITYTVGKKVAKYTLNDEFIREYDSLITIYREFNKTQSSCIVNVCNGKRITAYGFKWKWI